jgi:hypothetical protein
LETKKILIIWIKKKVVNEARKYFDLKMKTQDKAEKEPKENTT